MEKGRAVTPSNLHHAMLPRELKPLPLSGADRINRSLWGIYQLLKGERHRRIPEHIRRPKRVIVLGTDRIRRLRKKLNLSQEALASRLGVSGTMISHIEAGRSGISRKMDARMRRLESE